MITDPVADLITRLKNASNAGKDSLLLPFSSFRASILDLLLKEGYIKAYSKKGKKVSKFLEVTLEAPVEGQPKIKGVQQLSKLSKRVYGGSKDLKPVRHGFGLLVLSTPKGIIAGKEAKKENVGGELLFKIW